MKKRLFTLVAALALAAPAFAWPDKPITMVVPFPPGGSTDTLARALATPMQATLGQTIVVENRPGATGTIGAGQVKRSAADGYTLLVASLGPYVIAPHLVKSVPYDAGKDFDLLTVAVQAPNLLVVPANSPHKTLANVIAYEKSNPGKMTFASSGNGSSDHLTVELFWQQTGTSGVHVPYKGGAPAISDLLGGQVDASFQNINAVIQQVRAGKLRALAITSDKRSPLLPDVPTMAEAGAPGVNVYSWQAVAAPKGLPADVKKKLHGALMAALKDPGIQQRFVDVGFEIVGNTPEQFAAFQQQESARWKKVVETGNITAD
ncbi:LacI family transcriptional regulator [Acidovorax sp. SRB_14]|uniref:Bug family tripartite tricarboxylate transporter substrate binding protein n=1 Tax=unclassified Acidovorax TaxID=2684926 RepID=UPI00145DA306|nr:MULTISPECIES: tripartite tricarboxylate transporter substrate binding protein [unclassified Acidovorax]NMM76149.1 LacI family transcriptional regulator [Acidovorax sp. SRB_24]NMM81754.1 LacI family transcriptional regulator [Acidovorax sp. SRB_14]NMM86493.1 LacI family transcriptional regulator [Rhodococcus sp. SRB_17]